MSNPELFLSCDWGTTSFRLRLVALSNCEILHEFKEQSGVKTINDSLPSNLKEAKLTIARASAFEKFFHSKISNFLAAANLKTESLSIVISGMASSSVGWKELPYAHTPFPLTGARIQHGCLAFKLHEQNYPIHLLSGLQTETDIMRGEETEILGLHSSGNFDNVFANGIVLLPGTHSKHVRIQDNVIKDFCTYMTGELYDVVAQHSLLKASIDLSTTETPADSPKLKEAFITGALHARSHGLSRSLFKIRTRAILQDAPPTENRWFLSGLLIGTEVNDLVTQAPAIPILISAPSTIASLYEMAVHALDAQTEVLLAPSNLIQQASVLGQATWLKRHLVENPTRTN